MMPPFIFGKIFASFAVIASDHRCHLLYLLQCEITKHRAHTQTLKYNVCPHLSWNSPNKIWYSWQYTTGYQWATVEQCLVNSSPTRARKDVYCTRETFVVVLTPQVDNNTTARQFFEFSTHDCDSSALIWILSTWLQFPCCHVSF